MYLVKTIEDTNFISILNPFKFIIIIIKHFIVFNKTCLFWKKMYLDFLNKKIRARADSKYSILILLDLSAAFDTVNHQILPSTSLAKGISGTALQWFETDLSDRPFKVSWIGEVSKSQHLVLECLRAQFLDHLCSLSIWHHQYQGKLLLKVVHYNIALLHEKLTNYVT